MKLRSGLYEQVINRGLRRALQQTDEFEEELENIDPHQANQVLATYLSGILQRGLKFCRSAEGAQEQIAIANQLIQLFADAIEDPQFADYLITEGKLLTALLEKPVVEPLRPRSSLAHSSLFTGASSEPQVVSELKREIATADEIDLLVSFIKFSGIRLLLDDLEVYTRNKRLRVLTTSYMGASDYKAIEVLAQLPNTEVRISYDTQRTRLHAKAYYFHRQTGFSTAYIGSSNLSRAALTDGMEWNMKVSEYTSPEILQKHRVTFETYWNCTDFQPFDPNSVEDTARLRTSLQQEQTSLRIVPGFRIAPYTYQQEVLDALKAERQIKRCWRNLIVAATGTGKTVIAAFDFKDYFAVNPGCRFLFVAHRKEILQQSIATFRGILADQNFGNLWVGEHQPTSYERLFASVQTLNAASQYTKFPRDFFDYIVMDEIHHGAADSYERLLTHFRPRILLGLTATPERMDGQDILPFFDDRIACEIRLQEAIDRGLLCPFHYFGVADNVDLDSMRWTRGRYEVQDLSNLYTGNDMRAELIFRAIRRYLPDLDGVKGLGFCVSKEHARYMSRFFQRKGIPAIALDADSSLEERNTAQSRLSKGEIQFVFAVDIYNEGVDIPAVNTVLFLRPTESATVFIQQLGRGLRHWENKDVLTVLDFVGQANKHFDFRQKFRKLVGKSDVSVEREIENDFPALPKNCCIQLERLAKEHILANLKNNQINKTSLVRLVRNYSQETERLLNLGNFIDHYQLEPAQIYKSTSFYALCHQAGIKDDYRVKDQSKLKQALRRVMRINSPRLIQFLQQYLARDRYTPANLAQEEQLMLLMFYYTLTTQGPPGQLGATLQRLRRDNPSIFEEIGELLEYNMQNIRVVSEQVDLGFPCPLELYARYTIDQVLAATGKHTAKRKAPFQEGVLYLEEKGTDIFFVTLDKSSRHYSATTQYEDYAISEYLFHWQSQSRTSDVSDTGQRYIRQRKDGTTVLIFVREFKQENNITAPFYFLGKANYVSHSGSKPISFVWEMEKPIPAAILKKSNKIVSIV